MEKINFNNGTEPALNAPILNQLQKNIENEFIDSNDFKNLYSGYKNLSNLTYSNGMYTQYTADTRTELQWKIQGFNDNTYVKEITNITNKSIGRLSMSFVKDSSFNTILFGLNGSTIDTKMYIDASNLENGKTYTISWNLLNNVQGTIAWNEMQLEEGTSMTSYKNYTGVIVESGSNSNGEYIKFSDGTMICTKKVSGSTKIQTAWGSLFIAHVDLGSSPQTFKSIPTINYSVFGEYFWVGGTSTNKATVNSYGTIILIRPTALDTTSYEIDVIAIGKWK